MGRATWSMAVLGGLVLAGCASELAVSSSVPSSSATAARANEPTSSPDSDVDEHTPWARGSPVVPWGGPHRIGPSEASASSIAAGRGRRIDLDVRDADLKDVCRLLADVGRVSIVVADEGSERVTVKMKGVPWDQALDLIVRTKGLRMEREGSVVIVSK